jgi:hypothetical protein
MNKEKKINNPQTVNSIKANVDGRKSFLHKLFAKWIDVDLERYEKLQSENKMMKNKLADVENELKIQIKEMNLPCKYNENNINNQYPKDKELKNIADAYNNAANTERLIYKQKLQLVLGKVNL